MNPEFVPTFCDRSLRCISQTLMRTPTYLHRAYVSPFLWVARSLLEHAGHTVVYGSVLWLFALGKRSRTSREKMKYYLFATGLMLIHSFMLYNETFYSHLQFTDVNNFRRLEQI